MPRTLNVPGGEGREFADGEDVLWVLPGDPISDVADGEDAGAIYAELDARRTRLLRALGHHYAKAKVGVDADGGGTWGLTGRGGVSSSVDVGRGVTEVLRREPDDLAALRAVLDTSGLGRRASDARLRRCLEDGSPPTAVEPDEAGPLKITFTLADVLGLSATCRVLDELPEDAADADELRRSAEATAERIGGGRITAALRRVSERLTDVEASALFDEDGAVSLDFADGRGSLTLRPRGRKLARLVRRLGPEAAGDAVAARFRRLDRGRRRVLAAMLGTLANAGYATGGSLLSDGVTFGRQYAEFDADLGRRLTAGVEVRGEARTLRDLLPADLADVAVARLATLGDEPTVPELPHRALRPAPPPEPPAGPMTPEQVAAADAAAAAVLAAWAKAPERERPDVADPILHDPADDVPPRPAEQPGWRRNFTGCEPHHEASGIAELYRHRHGEPDLARKWLAAEWLDCYEEELEAAGDPRAVHALARRAETQEDDEDLAYDLGRLAKADPPTLAAVLADPARLRRVALAEAEAGGDHWHGAVALAMRHGWPEVTAAFAGSPAVHDRVLAWLRGGHEHEPLDDANEMALAWARLAPSPRLAAALAEMLTTDTRAGFDAAARQIGGEAHWREFSQTWRAGAVRPVALAWRLCRRA